MPNARARPPGLGVTGLTDGASPRQSADATAGHASAAPAIASAAADRTRLLVRLRRECVRLAQLRDVRGLVRLARDAAERKDAHGLIPAVDLAPRSRPNPHDSVRIERHALPIDLDLRLAVKHEEDLLLPRLGVVVLRVLGDVRRKSSTCIPNASTPSSARARLKPPLNAASM